MNFCVIGIGRFGYHVATTLAAHGMDVIAIDRDEHVIEKIKDEVTQAICMRVTDEESLQSIGIEDVETAIVAMGESFEQSVLVTTLLKQKLQIPTVITRTTNKLHKQILELIGADHVVLPEQEMGVRLADRLSLTFSSFTRLTENFSLSYLQAPKKFVNHAVGALKLRESYNVTCVGQKIDEEIVPLADDYVIEEEDVLVFAGPNKALEKLGRLQK